MKVEVSDASSVTLALGSIDERAEVALLVRHLDEDEVCRATERRRVELRDVQFVSTGLLSLPVEPETFFVGPVDTVTIVSGPERHDAALHLVGALAADPRLRHAGVDFVDDGDADLVGDVVAPTSRRVVIDDLAGARLAVGDRRVLDLGATSIAAAAAAVA